MRLRSRALPDVKLEEDGGGGDALASSGLPTMTSPRARARVDGRLSSPSAPITEEVEKGMQAGQRPARKRPAAASAVKLEPGGRRKAGVPGAWGAAGRQKAGRGQLLQGVPRASSSPPPLVARLIRSLVLTPPCCLGVGARAVILAAVVSLLFLLLVLFRPFASSPNPTSPLAGHQRVPHPPALADSLAPPAPLPPSPADPTHPSHADLLADGLREYAYERVVSHRVTLRALDGPDGEGEVGASAKEASGGEEDEALRRLAAKYGVTLAEFLDDVAEIGRG